LPRLPTQIFPSVLDKFSQFTISQWMDLIAILLLLFIVDEDIKAHSELLWAELLWAELLWAELLWAELLWAELLWAELLWAELLWAELLWVFGITGVGLVSEL
jgi:hypothetical protein